VIRNCTFTANSNSGGFGAGIYLLNSSLLIDSCQFTANNSNAYGGGLSNDHSLPTISNCIFKNNIAGYGGAIYNSFSNCKISSCQILLNSASNGDGGGIHCDNSSIIINNSYFNLNSGLTGCGLSSNSSSLVISNCSFVSNNGGSGPAVYISYDQSDNFTNCLFANNFTTGQGGAIFCNTGTLGVYNSTFLSNTSNLTDGGGAIWYTGKLTTANSIFWNNIAGTSSQDFSGFDTTTIHAAYCITKQALPTGTGFHISGADPLCVPVADNGGPVPTSALNDGCPAIDSGVYLYMDGNDSLMYNLNGKTTYYNLQGQPFTPTGTVTRVNATDARGVARPQRNGIDIGAFEKE
jgi:predicted outer membrane repeat protein